MMWVRIALAALTSFGLLGAPAGPAFAYGDTPLAVGVAAPPVVEPTTAGPFDSTASAKPYVLELFAVWCPHCQREVAVLNRLQRAEGNRIDILAVPASPFGLDHTSPLTPADLTTFAQRFNVTYRIGFDGLFAIPNAYGVVSYPTFYFVDAGRHIAAVESGEVPFEQLAAQVDALLR